MTMAAKTKEIPNFVHQNAILCETISKEQRHLKLYTNYSVNPHNRPHVITGKPNSTHDTGDGEEDQHFLSIIKRGRLEPGSKYTFPQTEAQEVGWITKPLLPSDRSDRRINFPRQNTSITKYMNAAWSLKEQTENLN